MKCPNPECQDGVLKEEPGSCPIYVCVCDKCSCGFVLNKGSLDPNDGITQAMKEMKDSLGDTKYNEEINRWPIFELGEE